MNKIIILGLLIILTIIFLYWIYRGLTRGNIIAMNVLFRSSKGISIKKINNPIWFWLNLIAYIITTFILIGAIIFFAFLK